MNLLRLERLKVRSELARSEVNTAMLVYAEGALAGAASAVTIAEGVVKAAEGISDVVGSDSDAREKFARELVSDLTSKYPDYDAVAAVSGDIQGPHIHQHAELNYKLGLSSQGYEVYLVKHGGFVHVAVRLFALHCSCSSVLRLCLKPRYTSS